MSTALRTYNRGADLVAMRDEVNLATRYYQFDHQGTTQCLTDQTGAVTDRFAADAWGIPVKRTGSSINRHWYVGNSGYYGSSTAGTRISPLYIRARYLIACHAAFLSMDPTHDGGNWFRYAGNSPASRTDPTGLRPTIKEGCPKEIAGTDLDTLCARLTDEKFAADIIKCANDLPLTNQLLRCLANWCTSNSVITCREDCPTQKAVTCLTGKGGGCKFTLDKVAKFGGESYGCISGMSNFPTDMSFCSYWWSDRFHKDCPTHQIDDVTAFPGMGNDVPSPSHVIVHELLHACTGSCKENGDANIDLETRLNKIATCILKKLKLKERSAPEK